ncbi:hypothetical protein [Microvirga pudoricolor]|uniref:hypothetical protein n=1 Tax=Microvirga pudoricolor TaxID=2778729 RepID=UPI001950EA6E|nr:hypothetical protein [Microvirga pudoricolor]MBM6595567.1 hypothetical protein [Microvirga pudoricolor]
MANTDEILERLKQAAVTATEKEFRHYLGRFPIVVDATHCSLWEGKRFNPYYDGGFPPEIKWWLVKRGVLQTTTLFYRFGLIIIGFQDEKVALEFKMTFG